MSNLKRIKIDVKAYSKIKDIAKMRINEHKVIRRDFMLIDALREFLLQHGIEEPGFEVEWPNEYFNE